MALQTFTGRPSDYEFVRNADGTISIIGNTGTTAKLASTTTQIKFSLDPLTYTINSGTTGSDLIIGNASNNTLAGGAGNDAVYGAGGNDIIYGGDGNDFISGGDGIDTMFGGLGNDIIEGGLGDDFLYGEAGNDTVFGGAGNDTIATSPGSDVLDGGNGIDKVAMAGNRADWTFKLNTDGSVNATNSVTGEVDVLKNFEFAQFGTAPAITISDLLGPTTGTPITITASGHTGQEQMQLIIKGQVVATYDNVPTTAKTYTYNAAGTVTANDIRIAFTNDAWAPGADRNLVVDKITVGGRVFETEASSVFSTGTWRPEDGIVAGYGRGDTLASNGFFQYAETTTTPGQTTIKITASGQTGHEQMQLIVKGQVVATFDNVAQNATVYTYQANSAITANDVRIAFTNDTWQPGYDRNLTVDKIDLNGQVFQTEAPTVYSTGVWLPTDGVVAGYGRGETLASNGYFQYATATNTSSALDTTLVTA